MLLREFISPRKVFSCPINNSIMADHNPERKHMLRNTTALILTLTLLTINSWAVAQRIGKADAIYSGVPWFDDRGQVVSAHGANIVQERGRYYLFGEAHTDTSNAFVGFNCYSSTDLYNWKFEQVALPVQPKGKLGPQRVGERPKVMKCPSTGEYILYMHVDTLGYRDQFVGYATAKTITGPYVFQGPLLFAGKPIRKWDMGTFQDTDGAGYVLIHGGEIYKLSDDYKSVGAQVNKSMTSGFESPAIFRKGNVYYFLGSDLTSWERNDNSYYTATSLQGPWTARGHFAPPGTLTWNSQTTFVLPVVGSHDTTYLFLGDRWSYPKQASAATYVWQPLRVTGFAITMPTYQPAWQVNLATGGASAAAIQGRTIENTDQSRITYRGTWNHQAADTLSESTTAAQEASFSVPFTGTRVGVYGTSHPRGGYARIELRNGQEKLVLSTVVDQYSKYPVAQVAFLSPVLPKGRYTLTVSVMAARSTWSDKRKTFYGSTGDVVSLDKIVVKE